MAQSEASLIGRTLAGRFRVTAFIGDGAMAAVYRAQQDGEPPEVAIKVMQPRLTADPTFVGRFRREAKAASAFRHPNSVTVYDWGVDEGVLYIAMELLSGQDLFERLVLDRRFPEAKAARILVDVCAALSAAHAQGIVHRDLKPENVMLARDADGAEIVKVLDFGIAKILDTQEGAQQSDGSESLGVSIVTRVGVVVGTPAYMSPEQCRGETIDTRSDLYACGVLLYQLVTGQLPFKGETPFDFAMQHVRVDPPRPTEHVPDLHPGLESVILKALAKYPNERQENAAALAAELSALLPELRDAPSVSMQAPRGSGVERQASDAASAALDRAETLVREQSPRAIPLDRSEQTIDSAPPSDADAAPEESRRPPPVLSTRSTASRLPSWLLVALALAIGVGVGVALFLLTRGA